MLFSTPDTDLTTPERDQVPDTSSSGDPPAVVSISDIHGYLTDAQSALLTLDDHPELPPVVVADADGTLHWAEENYMLVFNGDLIDRGPANDGVFRLVSRLIDEAPPGRVRVTLGNHEHILIAPDAFRFLGWYSTQVSTQHRRRFIQWIQSGHVIAAYRGHNVTYAHAGYPEPYDVNTVNKALAEAANELTAAIGTDNDAATQRRVAETYDTVLGTGDGRKKGPGAGLVWLGFSHLPPTAPLQVVGHTRHQAPAQKGDVYCQNVLQDNHGSPGGEAVLVETPDALVSLTRTADGGINESTLTTFE
jgi:hypothetical protein